MIPISPRDQLAIHLRVLIYATRHGKMSFRLFGRSSAGIIRAFGQMIHPTPVAVKLFRSVKD